jgi:hypothetical protein
VLGVVTLDRFGFDVSKIVGMVLLGLGKMISSV